MDALQAYLEGKSYSHIIWDWNGTLLDDFALCNELVCAELRSLGLPEVHPVSHRELFCFPIREFYESLGINFQKVSFEEMAKRYAEGHRKGVTQCKLFEEAEKFLEKTWAEGVSHSVLSAAQQNDLLAQVRHFGIEKYFTHIFGISDFLAASKVQRGKELLKTWGVNPKETLLIGDTDHDLEVGNELGIDVLLIADGHQSFEKLCRVHKDVLRSRKGRKP